MRTSNLLDIIHSDVCNPMKTESHEKAKYMVTFIDDCTRWCEVRFIKTRNEVLENFKIFVNFVENKLQKKVKCIQSDNGGEYVNEEFDKFLKEKRICRRLTVPYNPEQNGIAERKNRTLIETATCLLLQANLPVSFWTEAVNTANYIWNRCPNRSLKGITPYEARNGRKPTINFF